MNRPIIQWCVASAMLAALATVSRAQAVSPANPLPTGQLVDVGGYRVHLVCYGSARSTEPTVLIVGAGASFEWGSVIPAVATRTRVCAYDHSGTVWSDDGPTDSCILRVREVTTALERTGIAGPFVVVGHSVGALVARLFADRHPDRTAGMVIVDHAAAFPVQNVSLPEPAAPLAATPVIPGHIAQGQRVPIGEAAFAKLPATDFALHQWAASRPRDLASRQRSPSILRGCTAALGSGTSLSEAPLGDRPLVVLHVNDGEVISKTAGASPYARLQQQLAALSRNSRIVQVDRTSHYIMLDRPDAVIAALNKTLDQIRAPRDSKR
ncbi:MAG TPA: alpha/beta hydrolase [Gemmatimonadaceae bacterium]|nr:alpha/beta hydrolase [Gemmatimonadaceae bacterium]